MTDKPTDREIRDRVRFSGDPYSEALVIAKTVLAEAINRSVTMSHDEYLNIKGIALDIDGLLK